MNVFKNVKGGISVALLLLNTFVFASLVVLTAPIKLLVPFNSWKKAIGRLAVNFSEVWIYGNRLIFNLTQSVPWIYHNFPPDLKYKNSYLVISNHQSGMDILVLQILFNRKIPLLRFFIKQQLLFLPVLGQAFWALDFPFMKRYSKKELAENPSLANKDLDSARKACEKFKTIPVSVINFVEGTRFSREKHDRQQSPFSNLLKPKAGGLAMVLGILGEGMEKILDVTITYRGSGKSVWDFLSGKVKRIDIHIEEREISKTLAENDYSTDPESKEQFQSWLNQIWSDKDKLIDVLKSN